MQPYFLGGIVALVASATGLHAAPQQGKAVRVVKMISMTGVAAAEGPRPSASDRTDGGQGASSPAVAQGEPSASFRVHDLSRRWVEFQMASALAVAPANDAAAAADSQDPFGHVGVAQVGPPRSGEYGSAVSSIPIPAWMGGGPAFVSVASRYVSGCATVDYRPSGFLNADTEYRRQAYYAMMSNIACQYGIPVGLFDAMIIRESRYQAGVSSPKNAFGLTQLMPDTADGLGVDRYDIEGNLRGGAKYLREQLDRFGQVHLALAAYNAGPGRVRDGMVPRIAETEAYVDNILLNWSRLSGFSRTATVRSPLLTPAANRQTRLGRSVSISTF